MGGLYVDTTLMTVLPRWSTGRVLLLGDAAHCLLRHPLARQITRDLRGAGAILIRQSPGF